MRTDAIQLPALHETFQDLNANILSGNNPINIKNLVVFDGDSVPVFSTEQDGWKNLDSNRRDSIQELFSGLELPEDFQEYLQTAGLTYKLVDIGPETGETEATARTTEKEQKTCLQKGEEESQITLNALHLQATGAEGENEEEKDDTEVEETGSSISMDALTYALMSEAIPTAAVQNTQGSYTFVSGADHIVPTNCVAFTVPVSSNSVTIHEPGTLGLAFSGGVDADGTEMVTMVLNGSGCGNDGGDASQSGQWTTLSTVDASGMGLPIPTTALELVFASEASTCVTMASSSSSNNIGFSSACMDNNSSCSVDDAVFATPASTTSVSDPRNPFHFNQTRVTQSRSSSYSTSGSTRSSTRSARTSCFTPNSSALTPSDASTSSSPCPSVFGVDDDVTLVPLEQDDVAMKNLQDLNLTPLVKMNLKNVIKKRRHDSGLPVLQVDNTPKAKVKKEVR
jgi:hypothetical protein